MNLGGIVLVIVFHFLPFMQGGEYIVKMKLGNIKGRIREYKFIDGTNGKVAEFLGVPYAKPPIGALRFRKPVPASRFHKTYEANEYGKPCPQYYEKGDLLKRSHQPITSEDCLNLNIVTPNVGEDDRVFPVMVYVHGGRSFSGRGREASLYNGTLLASYGEVVVVTFDYRVGAFGFLSTGDHAALGNMGLWDQRLAIQWVNENIDRFGGDSSRITLIGQSDGAASVGWQALHEPNQNMFHRVISQSGSANAVWSIQSAGESLTNAKKLADSFNCSLGSTHSSKDIVECLRLVKNATAIAVMGRQENGFKWAPTVDNDFILLTSIHSIQWPPTTRPGYQNFDMLIGTTGFEGYYILSGLFDFAVMKTAPIPVLRTMMRNFVEQGMEHLALDPPTLESAIDAVMFVYSNAENPWDRDYNLKQISDFITDSLYFIPAYKDVASHEYMNNETKTYQYEYNHALPIMLPGYEWIRGDEAQFLMDVSSVLKGHGKEFINKSFPFSKTMMDYWTNFAKTGNPNKPRPVPTKWKPYSENDQDYLYFPYGGKPRSASHLKARRATFWLEYLPRIISRAAGERNGDQMRCSACSHVPRTLLSCIVLLCELILIMYN